MQQVGKEVKATPPLIFYKMRQRIVVMQRDLLFTLDPVLYRVKLSRYIQEVEKLKDAFKVLLKDYVDRFDSVVSKWGKQYIEKGLRALEKALGE